MISIMIYADKPANNILLIDINVPDYQQVVDSVNSNTLAIVYNYEDTFSDLSNILQNYDISRGRIGIFFESNSPFLNGSFFENVQSMIDLINYHKIPMIDFLACNTLNNPDWVNYYTQLPCIVGASNNETGNIQYGGDWNMENTGENIELIYFTQEIEYYKYLLVSVGTIIGTDSANDGFSSGIAVMQNTSTSTIIIHGTSKNNFIAFNYLLTAQTNTQRSYIQTTNGQGGMVIYTSLYTCPTSAGVTSPSKEYLLYTQINTTYIALSYNIVVVVNGGGSLIENTTWFNTGVTFQKYNSLVLFGNYVYYTAGLIVGRGTITDSTNGTTPTCGSNTTYLTSTTLGSSTSKYPTGIACDINGYLYIVLGYVDATPVGSNIVVFNGTTQLYTIDFSTTFNPVTYGYNYSLLWYSDVLYIGTYIGNYTTATTGYIFEYDTTNNTTAVYSSTNANTPAAMCVYNYYLFTTRLNGISGTTMNIYRYTPITVEGPGPIITNDSSMIATDSANSGFSSSLAIMKNTSTNSIIIHGTSTNNMIVFNYSLTSQDNTQRSYIVTNNAGGQGGMVVYTSNFNCPATAGVTTPSNQYLIYIQPTKTYLALANNILPTINGPGSLVENATWFNTANTLQKYNTLVLFGNYVYYTAALIVGRGTITDATVSGNKPTCAANVTYLTSAVLGSTASKYPTGIACDATGLLYVNLGNTGATPVGSNIVVFNGTTKVYTIDYSSTFNPLLYGYNYSLLWDSDILYIGTYIGSYASATNGNIFEFDTHYGTMSIYSNQNTNTAASLFIYDSYLFSVNLNGTGTTMYINAVNLRTNTITTYNSGIFSTISNIKSDIGEKLASTSNLTTTLPTTTYAPSGLNTGFYTYINGIKYDIATVYTPQPTIASSSTDLNIYTTIGGVKYDLSRIFNAYNSNTISNPNPNNLDSLTRVGTSQLYYYSTTSDTGSSGINFTINTPTTIRVLCIGGGGNGYPNNTAPTPYAGGGCGGGGATAVYNNVVGNFNISMGFKTSGTLQALSGGSAGIYYNGSATPFISATGGQGSRKQENSTPIPTGGTGSFTNIDSTYIAVSGNTISGAVGTTGTTTTTRAGLGFMISETTQNNTITNLAQGNLLTDSTLTRALAHNVYTNNFVQIGFGAGGADNIASGYGQAGYTLSNGNVNAIFGGYTAVASLSNASGNATGSTVRYGLGCGGGACATGSTGYGIGGAPIIYIYFG